MHRTAHDRRRLDLHACTATANHQSCDGPSTLARRCLNLSLQRAGSQRFGQTPERFRDQPRILDVAIDRQPGQINVHRQARQIVLKQVDSRAALERKARLLRQLGKNLDQ